MSSTRLNPQDKAGRDLMMMDLDKDVRDAIGASLMEDASVKRAVARHTKRGLNVRYHHIRLGTDNVERFNSTLRDAVTDALEMGQVEVHRRHKLCAARHAAALTVAIIEDAECREISRGYSFVGIGDQFSRPEGRSRAFKRALAEIGKIGPALAEIGKIGPA